MLIMIFSDEKVNVFSTKSTNPGKGATKAGKQTRERQNYKITNYIITLSYEKRSVNYVNNVILQVSPCESDSVKKRI